MTWAARYSRTEQPELTICDETGEVGRFTVGFGGELDEAMKNPLLAGLIRMTSDLAADIAARVPVTECEEPGCVNWAMPDGRCHHVHGGSDEL